MSAEIKVKLKGFITPQFVYFDVPTTADQIDYQTKVPLEQLTPEALSDLCDEFRKNMFAKLKQSDPVLPTAYAQMPRYAGRFKEDSE